MNAYDYLTDLDYRAQKNRPRGRGKQATLTLGPDVTIEARANDHVIRYFINNELKGRVEVCNVIREHLAAVRTSGLPRF